jgi:hypothetical protein
MIVRKSRLDIHVEKTENLMKYLLQKKKENIQNSLIRPLYQEALKSLFYVAVLLLDTLLPLEAYRSFLFPFNIICSLLILSVFVYIQIRVYNSIWGKKGRWSLEKYKKTIETTADKKSDGE